MKKTIKKILKEESTRQMLIDMINTDGPYETAVYVGGIENLVKIAFNNDIKEFYKESGLCPYQISSSGSMIIDDLTVATLKLKNFGKDELELGDYIFSTNSTGIKYKLHARLRKFTYHNGRISWKVVGLSGDSGFGYSFISKRNLLGKKAKKQIFKQIIDKYNLDQYSRPDCNPLISFK